MHRAPAAKVLPSGATFGDASSHAPPTRLQIVGDRYGVGIDDTHVRLRGAPVLDEPQLDVHQQVMVDGAGLWVWASWYCCKHCWGSSMWNLLLPVFFLVKVYFHPPHLFLPPPHAFLRQMIDDKLSVSELMTTSLIALPPVVPVRRLVDTLRMCNHQVGTCLPARPPAFLPVTDG